jgi:hypothetical protein
MNQSIEDLQEKLETFAAGLPAASRKRHQAKRIVTLILKLQVIAPKLASTIASNALQKWGLKEGNSFAFTEFLESLEGFLAYWSIGLASDIESALG